jgi:hypothetical protein
MAFVSSCANLCAPASPHEQAVQVSLGNPLGGLVFPDRYFDLVLATHVVHGLQTAQRRRFYSEVRRVSQGLVL